jgi:hypothetical protein
MSKVIVTGGRRYGELETVIKVLDSLSPSVIIEGGATGADALAREYASLRNLDGWTYQADWKDLSQPDARIKEGPYGSYDAQAGHRRNKVMLEENLDSVLVAFPGGHGTADCVAQAKKMGIKVILAEEHLGLLEAL